MADRSQYLVDPSDGKAVILAPQDVERAKQAGYTDASDEQVARLNAQVRAAEDPLAGAKAFTEAAIGASVPAFVAGIPALAMGVVPSAAEIGAKLGIADEETAQLAKQKRLELAEEIAKYTTVPGLEQTLGISTAEDIRARQEAAPVASGLGTLAGFIGPGILAKAGLSAARLGTRAAVAAEEAAAAEAAALAYRGEEATARALADKAVSAAQKSVAATAKADARAALMSRVPGAEEFARNAERALGTVEKYSTSGILSEISKPVYRGVEESARALLESRLPGVSELTKQIVAKAVALPVGSAVEGALLSTGAVANEMALGRPELVAEQALSEIPKGALFAGGLGGALGLVGVGGYGAIQGARSASRKVAELFQEKFPAFAARMAGADIKDVQALMRERKSLSERSIGDIIDERLGRLPAAPVMTAKDVNEIASRFSDALQEHHTAFDNLERWMNKTVRKMETGSLIEQRFANQVAEIEAAMPTRPPARLAGIGEGTGLGARDLARIAELVGEVRPVEMSPYQLAMQPYREAADQLLLETKKLAQLVDDPAKYPDIVRSRISGIADRFERFLESDPGAKDMYLKIDKLKADVWGETAPEVERQVIRRANQDANGAIRSLYGKFASFVKDEGLWGTAGKRQAEWSEMLTNRNPAKKNYLADFFKKETAPGGRTIYRVDRDKVRSIIKRLDIDPVTGQPTEESVDKVRRLFDVFRADSQLLGEAETTARYAEQNFDKQLLAATARRTAGAFDDAMQRVLDTVAGESATAEFKSLQAARKADVDARIAAIEKGAKHGGTMDALDVVKHSAIAHVSPTLAVVSAAIHGGARLAKDPVRTIKTFNALERMAKSANAKIDGGLDAVVAMRPGRVVAPVSSVVLSPKAEREEYDENVKRLAALNSDLNAMQDHLDDSVGELRHDAPILAGHAEATTAAAAGYLAQRIPQPPPNLSPMQAKSWKPNDNQVREFNRIYRTVDMPLGILGDASRGTLTRDQVQAIDAIYPTLMGEIRQRMIKRIDDNPDLSASSRRMASLILGLDLDGQLSPQMYSIAQSVYGQQAPQQEQTKMPVSRASKLRVAERSAEYDTAARRNAQIGARR